MHSGTRALVISQSKVKLSALILKPDLELSSALSASLPLSLELA